MNGPLLGVSELDASDPRLAIADCRWVLTDPEAGRRSYLAGHVPGAIYVSLDDDLSDMSRSGAGRHPLPSKERFAATLGRLGIGNDAFVVVYDDVGGAYASRLWWLLRWIGHGDVAVLDGGWKAWQEAGLRVDDTPVELVPTTYRIGSGSMPVVDRDVVAGLGDERVLVDARATERYTGEVEPLDPAAGHIPGAINVPYAGNLDRSGRFLGPAELRARYGTAGVTDGSRTIVYCGSGVTACHDILAIEAAGLGTAALYPGSWSEWSGAGGDIATGGR